MRPDVVLAAHGSRDSRAAVTIRGIARRVGAACAFLDFEAPSLGDELRASTGPRLVVPLLLTPAYHARVDIPAVVDHARSEGADVEIATPLGSADAVPLLAAALDRRLPPARYDALVVAAAGSRDLAALEIVDDVAAELSDRRGVPVASGFASGAGRSVYDAVLTQCRNGARNVGLALYFLAPGVLPDRAVEQAMQAGAQGAAEPLGDVPEVVELINRRIAAPVFARAR
jgi:sirohydrochlorin ferrochelatase